MNEPDIIHEKIPIQITKSIIKRQAACTLSIPPVFYEIKPYPKPQILNSKFQISLRKISGSYTDALVKSSRLPLHRDKEMHSSGECDMFRIITLTFQTRGKLLTLIIENIPLRTDYQYRRQLTYLFIRCLCRRHHSLLRIRFHRRPTICRSVKIRLDKRLHQSRIKSVSS